MTSYPGIIHTPNPGRLAKLIAIVARVVGIVIVAVVVGLRAWGLNRAGQH
jgi:hypothetical protein